MAGSSDDLVSFVGEALARGIDRERIGGTLRQAGWPEEKVRKALAAYAEVDFPLPVPRPQPYLSAREAFLYLLTFTALLLSSFYVGAALFELIDLAFPESDFNRYSPDFLRFSVAFIAVAFPLYLGLAIRQAREVRRDPVRRSSRVRKWLTYLTLFIAAGTLIGDLVALINGVLYGDLATGFLLRVLVVALIAGAAFGYYIHDLRRDDDEASARPSGLGRGLLVGAIVLVGTTVVQSLLVLDSPGEERRKRLDARRVSDLRGVAAVVERYWEQNERLPASLLEVAEWQGIETPQRDPETGAPYSYRPGEGSRYELCATFAREYPGPRLRRRHGNVAPAWHHPAGEHCFQRAADEDAG